MSASTPKKRRLLPRRKKVTSDLPSAWRLLLDTYRILITNWRILGAITIIFAVFYLVFIRVVPETELSDYEDVIDTFWGGQSSATAKSLVLAGVALQNNVASGLGINGLLLWLVASLAFIWVLRHIAAGKKFTIRDSLYQSQTPLIPFTLVSMLLVIQLLPFALGGLLYALVQTQNIAVTLVEDLLFLAIWVVLAFVSGFLISNTLMASYAVTLPGIYPLEAIKATKRLVKGRRWPIFRKIIFLPIFASALFFISFLFVVTVAPDLAYWFLDFAAILTLPIAHTYYYSLYRSVV